MLPREGVVPSSDSRTSVAACRNGLMTSARMPQASSFSSAPSMRSGWNGLRTKSLAPARRASMTMACWPMAVTMATRAFGSSFLISFSAASPSISGMVISRRTASGRCSAYCRTASAPFSAGTTSCPLSCSTLQARKRMNAASSTTITLATNVFSCCGSSVIVQPARAAGPHGVSAGPCGLHDPPRGGRCHELLSGTVSFVLVDGLRLHFQEWAGADPRATVVLVHGLGSSSHIWDLVGPLLARDGFRVVALDQRGHGESDQPDQGYDFRSIVADLSGFME